MDILGEYKEQRTQRSNLQCLGLCQLTVRGRQRHRPTLLKLTGRFELKASEST